MSFLKWHPWIPDQPFAKQVYFLSLKTGDALTGGNLGGGKSSTLLMSALQYMDVPGFSCLILRRKLTDLKLAGSLLSRGKQWLDRRRREGLVWNADTHTYEFPTVYYETMEDAALKRNPQIGNPANLTFGYIGDGRAEDRYRGTEWNRIVWDELTQHQQYDFEYMFTRGRSPLCSKHRDEFEETCWECNVRSIHNPDVRAATNPDGVGRLWVKSWYSIVADMDPEEARKVGKRATYYGADPERPFVPSSYRDNPYIDHEEYERTKLANLDPTRREQLQYGQWDVVFAALFKRDWFRKYRLDMRDGFTYRYDALVDALANRVEERTVRTRDMMIFVTVDPAASVASGIPQDLIAGMDFEEESTSLESSRSAAAVWGCLPDKKCFLLDLFVGRVEIPDLIRTLVALDRKWRPEYFRIEKNGLGMGVFQYAKSEGLPVKGYSRGTGDKIVHATDAIRLASSGHFYVPENATWLSDWANEVYNWVGHKDQGDDVVDCLSEAGHVLSGMTKFTSQADNLRNRTWNKGGGVVFGTDGTALDASGGFIDAPLPGSYGYSPF